MSPLTYSSLSSPCCLCLLTFFSFWSVLYPNVHSSFYLSHNLILCKRFRVLFRSLHDVPTKGCDLHLLESLWTKMKSTYLFLCEPSLSHPPLCFIWFPVWLTLFSFRYMCPFTFLRRPFTVSDITPYYFLSLLLFSLLC